MTDVDHDLTGQCFADFFNLYVLAQFVDHPIDRHQFGVFERTLEHRHVEFFLFVLNATAFGGRLRIDRNDPTVLRHVPGEIGGANLVGRVDDVLFVRHDQRTQDQFVGHAVDHRQIRQGLARHLGDRLAGNQRFDVQAIGDVGSRAQHHTLQYDAHMTVIDFAENFAQHFFERNTDK
ncbi:hypothetical protein D3C87_1330970 [compost metagenome]